MSSQPTEESRPSESELESLRSAFAAHNYETPDPDLCPEPDRLWSAVQGELLVAERLKVIEHTGVCSTCAEEWRLAKDLSDQGLLQSSAVSSTVGSDTDSKPEEKVLSGLGRFRRVVAPLAGLAAAAMLMWVVVSPPQSDPPAFRAGESSTIESLLPTDEPLTREDCVLRWSAEEGAVYSVLVSDADLVVLSQEEDLTESEYRVAPERLEHLAAGTELYWQVTAVLPDGSSRASKTFVHRLE